MLFRSVALVVGITALAAETVAFVVGIVVLAAGIVALAAEVVALVTGVVALASGGIALVAETVALVAGVLALAAETAAAAAGPVVAVAGVVVLAGAVLVADLPAFAFPEPGEAATAGGAWVSCLSNSPIFWSKDARRAACIAESFAREEMKLAKKSAAQTMGNNLRIRIMFFTLIFDRMQQLFQSWKTIFARRRGWDKPTLTGPICHFFRRGKS